MTAPELISHFNRIFGLNGWPKTYEVDAETYANCCQYLFDNDKYNWALGDKFQQKIIALGLIKNGLMFKGVELILQGYKR